MAAWKQVAHSPVVDVAEHELAHVDLLASAKALSCVHLIRYSQQRVFIVGACIASQKLKLPGSLHQTPDCQVRRRLLLRDRWPAGKVVPCWPGFDAPRDLQQAVRQRSHTCGRAGSPLLLDRVGLQCPANAVNSRPMQEASCVSLVFQGMHTVDKESQGDKGLLLLM